jgi:FlaA1/EpsC-like NDP-sugar epimerase
MHFLLGRPEVRYPRPTSLPATVVVTGAGGSVGLPLCSALRSLGTKVVPLDLPRGDVLNRDGIATHIWAAQPCLVYHLAADKHAPAGEEHPFDTTRVNVEGTQNVLDACRDANARVILASTCKAAVPETAYGASKLIAERMVLNDGFTVGRLVNVVESSRNVFEIWGEQKRMGLPLTYVHDAKRFFVTMREAVDFLLYLADLKPGRYAPDPGHALWLKDVAKKVAGPRHNVIEIDPRRGDRLWEPECGAHEKREKFDYVYRITSPHDAEVAA